MDEEKVKECPEDDGSLHALFLRCSNIISRRLGRSASRRRILALLSERGELTQRQLQELLGIQAGSLSELVARMEARGVVTREPDGADRRRIVLRLTPHGRELAAQPRQLGDERLFSALTPEEQGELRRMLQKIADDYARWTREVSGK